MGKPPPFSFARFTKSLVHFFKYKFRDGRNIPDRSGKTFAPAGMIWSVVICVSPPLKGCPLLPYPGMGSFFVRCFIFGPLIIDTLLWFFPETGMIKLSSIMKLFGYLITIGSPKSLVIADNTVDCALAIAVSGLDRYILSCRPSRSVLQKFLLNDLTETPPKAGLVPTPCKDRRLLR